MKRTLEGKCTTVRLNDVRTFLTAFLGGFFGKICAAVVLAICAVFGFGPDWIAKLLVSTPLAVTVLRAIFLGLGASVLAVWAYQTFGSRKAQPESAPSKPLTLRECFDKDFTNLLRILNQLQVQSVDAKETVTVDCALFLDHAANTDFMSLYIPHCSRAFIVCGHLAGEVARIRDELKSRVGAHARVPGDITMDKSSDLAFSGRVFVYYEDELSLQELAALDNVYREKQLSPKFRGQSHAVTRWLQVAASQANAVKAV
jgi:hypothetical protein